VKCAPPPRKSPRIGLTPIVRFSVTSLTVDSFSKSENYIKLTFVIVKPGPHQQHCRSNFVECYKVECCFDKVDRCFDIVAGVDRALGINILVKSFCDFRLLMSRGSNERYTKQSGFVYTMQSISQRNGFHKIFHYYIMLYKLKTKTYSAFHNYNCDCNCDTN